MTEPRLIYKEIIKCVDCPHFKSYFQSAARITKCTLSNKSIPDIYDIPDWCKLEKVMK